MPNTLSYAALFAWPVVVAVLFATRSRPKAILYSILGGYLLLPSFEGIDLPMLPPIDKTLVPSLSVLLACLVMPRANSPKPRSIAGRNSDTGRAATDSARVNSFHQVQAGRNEIKKSTKPTHGGSGRNSIRKIETILIALVIFTPVITYLTNGEAYVAGPRIIRGIQLYDAFSMILAALVSLLPYYVARRFLNDDASALALLQALAAAAFLYSFLALFEVRMSPQLSTWIYGFFPHSFAQHMRGGGFRPLVFLEHGLRLAIFMAMAIVAAFAVWRSISSGRLWLAIGLWLLIALFLSHSLGAFVIAIVLLPIIAWLGRRKQIAVAAILATLFILYPVLRTVDVVPTQSAISLAKSVNLERAQSLEFRIRNEDALLERAREKPFAGWGQWGRSRIYDQNTGRDISVTDGVWVIVFGTTGWLGYVGHFGLLALPILGLFRIRRSAAVTMPAAGLAVALSANMVDMIPNSSLTPITWLIAGVLMNQSLLLQSKRNE